MGAIWNLLLIGIIWQGGTCSDEKFSSKNEEYSQF